MNNLFDSFISGYVDCNREENILLWQRFMKPQIVFGVPLEEFMGSERSASTVFRQIPYFIGYKGKERKN